MKHSILLVDDEPNVLRAFRRNLRNDFDVHVAESGAKGMGLLKTETIFSVIVSDMQMPEMNGVEFLKKSKEVQPNAIRVMLTGNADQQTAIDAINHGDIFRFINKPSTPQIVSEVLHASIHQYKLNTIEEDLLETTLRASISALSETLSLASPEIFGRTSRLKGHIARCVTLLGVKDAWRYEALAMLCLVGLVSLPSEAIKLINDGERLDANYGQMYIYHSELAYQLISKIPRMEEIATSIRYQNKNYNGGGYPENEMSSADIPVASRLLKIVIDFDHFETLHKNSDIAIQKLEAKSGIIYDPRLLDLFKRSLTSITHANEELVKISDLDNSMTLARDVKNSTDVLLLSKGLRVSDAVISRLSSFHRSKTIRDSVFITAR